MKTTITIILLWISVSTTCFAQQYGWMDISNNLPSSSGTTNLPNLYFVNDNEGWLCSSVLGEIYHTTDGGSTYTTQTTQYSTNAIHMLNSGEGYAGGLNGRVYRTTDGGGTWNVLGSIGGTLRSISFPPSSTTGYCCGDAGRIYSITSTGVTSMSSGVSSNLKSISFPGSQGFVCGQSAILHYNGSWLRNQTYPSASYNGICMVNNTTGWAVGDAGVIVKTTDGLNWSYQTNPDTSNRSLYDVSFLNTSEGWAVGFSGVILHTTNGGALWTIEASGMTTNSLNAVQFTSSTNGYVLGNNGTLLKFGLLTDVEESKLCTNDITIAPNPIDDRTAISFNLEKANFVSVQITDMLGNVIADVIIDKFIEAGEQKFEFDSKNLTSGTYFCTIKAGNHTKTVKFVVLK